MRKKGQLSLSDIIPEPVRPVAEINTFRIQQEFPLPDYLLEQRNSDGLHNLSSGDYVESMVLGVSIQKQALTSKGKPYLLVTLFDRTGSLRGTIWENEEGFVARAVSTIENNPVLRFAGKLDEFPRGSGRLQLNVRELSADDSDVRSVLPLASEHYDVGQELAEMISLYQELAEPYRSLVFHGLKKHWNQFCVAPAAKQYHHAFIGGLLIHTAQLAKIVDHITRENRDIRDMVFKMAEMVRRLQEGLYSEQFDMDEPPTWIGQISYDHLYQVLLRLGRDDMKTASSPEQIRNVCMAATFWHDLGKIAEYDYASGIGMHETGKLMGHISIGLQLMDAACNDLGIDHDIAVILKHVVLSHHGKLEFGSPVWPQTPEALVFHFCDYVGSRLS